MTKKERAAAREALHGFYRTIQSLSCNIALSVPLSDLDPITQANMNEVRTHLDGSLSFLRQAYMTMKEKEE